MRSNSALVKTRPVKCGNSLIGADFFSGQMFAEAHADVERIRPFDWEREFPQVFGSTLTPALSLEGRGSTPLSPAGRGVGGEGGFDAVIGNPPYIRIHNLIDYYPNAFCHRG